MGLQAKSFNTAMDVPAEGTVMARLVGLIDLGHQPGYEYQGEDVKSSYKITFTYELPGSRTEDDHPHWVSEDVNVSDFVGDGIISKMMKRVHALDPRGDVSGGGKDLSKLIGQPCMINIKHNKKGYPQVKDVVSAPAGIPIPELENAPVIFNMDTPDMEAYNKFSDFVKKKINSALDLEDTAFYAELQKQQLSGDDVNF